MTFQLDDAAIERACAALRDAATDIDHAGRRQQDASDQALVGWTGTARGQFVPAAAALFQREGRTADGFRRLADELQAAAARARAEEAQRRRLEAQAKAFRQQQAAQAAHAAQVDFHRQQAAAHHRTER